MNKLYPSATAALKDILKDGQTLGVGGFGLCGIPEALIAAVSAGTAFEFVPFFRHEHPFSPLSSAADSLFYRCQRRDAEIVEGTGGGCCPKERHDEHLRLPRQRA